MESKSYGGQVSRRASFMKGKCHGVQVSRRPAGVLEGAGQEIECCGYRAVTGAARVSRERRDDR